MGDLFVDIKNLLIVNMDTKEDIGNEYITDETILLNDGSNIGSEMISNENLDLSREVMTYSLLVSKTIRNIYGKNMNQEDKTRLRFLNETVVRLVTYLNDLDESIKSLEAYKKYMKMVFMRLHDTYNMVNKISAGQLRVADNFDVFELKMRGYLQEIEALFPKGSVVNTIPSPNSLINEELPREMWIKHFGSSRYFISFEELLVMLESEEVCHYDKDEYERFKMFLKYFMNFPSDDLISPFKWNQIIHLFGPFDNFCINFMETVTKRGFLGLINRVKAYEILKTLREPRSLIIRLSRTEPQYFAFTYRNTSGHIGHLINKAPDGSIIRINDFIESKFSGYRLVNMSLDIEKILSMPDDNHFGVLYNTITLFEYAKGSYSDYIHSNE